MDEQQPMGEFTRKFEREIMGRKVPDAPDNGDSRRSRILSEIKKIFELIIERKDWLRQRFPNIKEEENRCENGAGLKCIFPKDETHPRNGSLEFRTRSNDENMAVFLECTIEIEGMKPVNDYVSFPTGKLNEAKVRKFIQDKIFSFAKEYMAPSEK